MSELMRLGLTEYEAKTYFALLELGQTTAGDVARRTGIPRNRVYDTLDELSNQGLVQIILDEPRLYNPLPFEGYLERRIRELERGAESLRLEKTQIGDRLKVVSPTETAAAPGSIKIVKGTRSNDALLADLVKAAAQCFHATLTSASLDRLVGESESRAAVEEAIARGVDVRLVIPVSKETLATAKAAADLLGPRVRAHREGSMHISRAMVDHERLYLRQHVGNALRSAGEVGFITDSAILVADAAEYLQTVWQSASALGERVDEIQSGRVSEWERATRDLSVATNEMVAAIREAKREIVCMTDTTTQFPPHEIQRIAQAIAEAAGRGVSFRLITRIAAENAAQFQMGPPIGETRHLDSPDFRFQIVDDAHLTEMVAASADGSGLTITGTIRDKIAGYRSLFEERWRLATPIADRLENLGRSAPKIDIYGGGDEGLRVWNQIAARVTRSVDCLAHVSQYEATGRKALEGLKERRALGIRHRFVVVGGRLSADLEKTYRDEGVEFRYSTTPLVASIVVADGRIALVSPYMVLSPGAKLVSAFRWITEDISVLANLNATFEATWASAKDN